MTEETPGKATLVLYGLQKVLKDPDIDKRLLEAKNTIVAIESSKIKLTHKLAEEIRRILKSVTKSSKATQDQLDAATDLKARLFSRSPRRKKNQETKSILDDVVSTGKPGSILDDVPAAKRDESWTTDGFNEHVRLMAIDREAGDFKSKIRKALDDRAETVPNLVLLLTFIRKHSIRGPMFEKLEKTLIEMGAVKAEAFDWGEVGHPSTWIVFKHDSTGAVVLEDNPQSPRFGRGKIK